MATLVMPTWLLCADGKFHVFETDAGPPLCGAKTTPAGVQPNRWEMRTPTAKFDNSRDCQTCEPLNVEVWAKVYPPSAYIRTGDEGGTS